MLRHAYLHRAAPIAAAVLIALAPTVALADDDEKAAAAIAAAKAKIATLDQMNAEDVGEIKARAQAALDRAAKENDQGDEDRARHAANEASAYAELALATAELRAAEKQRDELRATTATPGR